MIFGILHVYSTNKLMASFSNDDHYKAVFVDGYFKKP